MSSTAKATEARMRKLANGWKKRLERMGLGLRALGMDDHNISYEGLPTDSDRNHGPVVEQMDASSIRPDIAAVFKQETEFRRIGGRVCRISPYSRSDRREWPNPEDTHVNERARVVGGIV